MTPSKYSFAMFYNLSSVLNNTKYSYIILTSRGTCETDQSSFSNMVVGRDLLLKGGLHVQKTPPPLPGYSRPLSLKLYLLVFPIPQHEHSYFLYQIHIPFCINLPHKLSILCYLSTFIYKIVQPLVYPPCYLATPTFYTVPFHRQSFPF